MIRNHNRYGWHVWQKRKKKIGVWCVARRFWILRYFVYLVHDTRYLPYEKSVITHKLTARQ